MSSVFDILLKCREIEGIREMLTFGNYNPAAVWSLFPGESSCYKVDGNLFVVYHASKIRGRLDNGPECGPNK